MMESIFSKITPVPGAIARVKTAAGAKAAPPPASTPSSAERRLAALVTLSGEAQARLEGLRRLDAHLRIFSSALRIFNSFFGAGYAPLRGTPGPDLGPFQKSGVGKVDKTV